MDAISQPKRSSSRRHWILGLLLAATFCAASWCLDWNQRVQSPDPAIVIHTEAEALRGACRFLSAAKIDSGRYELALLRGISKDRNKGQDTWRIVWPSKRETGNTNDLIVLVGARGWCNTDMMTGANEGISFQGTPTQVIRQPFRLN